MNTLLNKLGLGPKESTIVALLQASQIFIMETLTEAARVKEESKAINKELTLLKQLGLGKSNNALTLSYELEKVEDRNLIIDKANALVKVIKIANKYLGDSFLVSFDSFKKVLAQHGLVIGRLQDYIGNIPESNIQDLARVKENLASSSNVRGTLSGILNRGMNSERYIFVTEAKLDYDRDWKISHQLRKRIKENNGILKVYTYDYYKRNFIKDIAEDGINVSNLLGNGEIIGTSLAHDDFLIACPKKLLDPKTEFSTAVKPKPVPRDLDPIVFSYTPYGVLVHTIWGVGEVNDSILKKYREINSLVNAAQIN